MFALFVVVLAKQLQELEGSSVGSDAELVVDELVGGIGFKYIFPQGIFLIYIVVIIIIHGFWWKFSI